MMRRRDVGEPSVHCFFHVDWAAPLARRSDSATARSGGSSASAACQQRSSEVATRRIAEGQ